MIPVMVLDAADMERVAGILDVQIRALIGIGGKCELEPAGHNPAP